MHSNHRFTASKKLNNRYFGLAAMLPLECRRLLSAGPTATFLQPYVAGKGSSRTFAIYYTGSTAIDTSTLGNNDVIVSGPDGFSGDATFVGLIPDTRDPGIVAQYRVSGIKGGAYAVQVQAGSVADTVGSSIPQATIGGFRVGQHGRTTPRGPAGPAFSNAVIGTDYGPESSPPLIDTSFGAVLQAINIGGDNADLPGSDGKMVDFVGLGVNISHTPATIDTSPLTVTLDSQTGDDLFDAATGSVPVYETEVFDYNQETMSMAITGLNAAAHYRFQFLHGDSRLGSFPYDATQTFTLSTGQELTTPLTFNTQADNQDSDTIVDVTGTTSLTYSMPNGGGRGPSFSGVVIEATPGPFPSAQLVASTARQSSATATFNITYSDPSGILTSRLGRGEVIVTDSSGSAVPAKLVATSFTRHSQHVVATYQITGAGRGASYHISLAGGLITGRTGATVSSEVLGTLAVAESGYAYVLIG